MGLSDIVSLIKERVSIFGIYKLHDDMEESYTELKTDVKIAGKKLEFLYRSLDKERRSTKKKKAKKDH